MKKTIVTVLIALLVACHLCAFAETIDLSSFDDDTLVNLLSQVQQEIVTRHIEKTAELKGGTYIGGRDIPVGTYIYTCMATGDDWGNVTVYTLDAEGKHDEQLLWKVVSAPEGNDEPTEFLFSIGDGDELSSGVPFSLTIYAGVQFK